MKTLALIFCLIISTEYGICQMELPGIIDMYIIPAEPTEIDELKLAILSKHTSFPCWLDSASIEYDGNSIHVYTEYWTGLAASLCYSLDTIPLGQFDAGHYFLVAYYDHGNFQDSDSLSFFVGTPTNVALSKESRMELSVFPNPVASGNLNGSYTLETMSEVEMEVSDISGKRVAQKSEGKQPPGEYTFEIDLENLPTGVYLFKLRTNDEVLSRRVVVQ